ncbi:hypothetical protein QTJ16_001541 [Diplocarpon rosae]|uniref:Uncharacterized protein n=1 Tax=Diplocarpon rosae TaxID=946125 RepID=A0AAD9T3Z8_9HELO|nr:hypothetical protein QTJ16_001541 [Diplocarpon rosae]
MHQLKVHAVLIRYCDDQFDNESSTATIGVDFKVRLPCPYPSRNGIPTRNIPDSRTLKAAPLQTKTLSIHNTPYRLNLLDTAGQERFRTLSNSYYRGAHGVILVYDISNRDSFLAMPRWFDEVEANAQPGAVTYLVGAKLDRDAAGQRAVSAEEGRRLAEERSASGWCEVSSKTRENVRKPFVECVGEVVRRPELLKGGRRGTVSIAGGQVEAGGCAC